MRNVGGNREGVSKAARFKGVASIVAIVCCDAFNVPNMHMHPSADTPTGEKEMLRAAKLPLRIASRLPSIENFFADTDTTRHHSTHDNTAAMPQNEYMKRFTALHGRRLDHEERTRKRTAREAHHESKKAQNYTGLRAKLHQQKRHKEKIQMKKAIKQQEEKNVKSSEPAQPSSTPLPSYLLDRSNTTNAKALSSAIKNKRAEKAAKFSVPLPKVRGISEEEMFKVVKTGKKTAKKSWKRMITKPTFVGPDFTRRPVKYERFIRPMGLRYKKANVTHPELGVTVQLPIISVKKNPQNPMYTQLGVLTKGTIIEVNVSELGLVTAGGKVVWGRWAQITNNCENDGKSV